MNAVSRMRSNPVAPPKPQISFAILKQRVDSTGSLDVFFHSKGRTTRIDSQKTSRSTHPDVRIAIAKNSQHWLVTERRLQSSTPKSRTTPSKQSVIGAHPQFLVANRQQAVNFRLRESLSNPRGTAVFHIEEASSQCSHPDFATCSFCNRHRHGRDFCRSYQIQLSPSQPEGPAHQVREQHSAGIIPCHRRHLGRSGIGSGCEILKLPTVITKESCGLHAHPQIAL